MTEFSGVNPVVKLKKKQNANKTSVKNSPPKIVKKPAETVKKLPTNVRNSREHNLVLKQKVQKTTPNKGVTKKSKTQSGATSNNVANSPAAAKKPQQYKSSGAKDAITNTNKEDEKKIKSKRTLKSNTEKSVVKKLKPMPTIVTNLTNNDKPQLVAHLNNNIIR